MLSPPYILKIRRRRRKLFILLDADNCDARIYLHFCIHVIDNWYTFIFSQLMLNAQIHQFWFIQKSALSSRSSFCVNSKASLLCFLRFFLRCWAVCNVSALWRMVLAGRKWSEHYPLSHHLRQTTMASSIRVWQLDESKAFFEILTRCWQLINYQNYKEEPLHISDRGRMLCLMHLLWVASTRQPTMTNCDQMSIY